MQDKFKKGDRVTSDLWKCNGTFDRYQDNIGECDCIIIRDDHPEYEYAAFSFELKLIDEKPQVTSLKYG
jgi:hypothetical protein